MLGVKVETLYAYVSRGFLNSHAAPGPGRHRLYRRSEVEGLRQGRSRVSERLRWGDPLVESAVSWITADGPVYRNRPAIELVGEPFEAVAELLWTGELPSDAPLWPAAFRPPDIPLPETSTISALTLLVAGCGLADHERFLITPEATLPRARRLIATMAGSEAPVRQGPVASLLATTLGADASEQSVTALNSALVLLAEHEMNASTFAVRVVASTDADLYACVSAGLAALSGPRHGGAGERVGALLDEIADAVARDVVMPRLQRGESVAGFGHRLYPNGDPRAGPLLDAASRLDGPSRVAEASLELVEVAREAGLPPPNVDLGLAALVGALGLPWSATGLIFAVARSAGWVAHALEQYEAAVLIRPRARRA